MPSTQTEVNTAMVNSAIELTNFNKALKSATASLGDLSKQAKPATPAKPSGVSADLQQLVNDIFGKGKASASAPAASPAASSSSTAAKPPTTPALEQLIDQLIAAIFNKGKASPGTPASATPAAAKPSSASPVQTALEQVVADIFKKAQANPQAVASSPLGKLLAPLLGKTTADASKPAASTSTADKASPGSTAEQQMVKLLQQLVDQGKPAASTAAKPQTASTAPADAAAGFNLPPVTSTLSSDYSLTVPPTGLGALSGVDPALMNYFGSGTALPTAFDRLKTPPGALPGLDLGLMDFGIGTATTSAAAPAAAGAAAANTQAGLAKQGASAASAVESAWSNSIKATETALTSLVTTGKVNFKSLADSIISDIIRMAMQALIEGPILKMLGLGGSVAGAGAGAAAGAMTGAGDLITSTFALAANGGVMTSAGMLSLPANAYSSGGVATSPQLAVFGEGRTPEAYVPLPDGRSIPVTMKGGGASSTTTGGHTFNTSVVVNSDGSSTVTGANQGRQFAKVVQAAIRQELLNQRRDGGLLSASPTGAR